MRLLKRFILLLIVIIIISPASAIPELLDGFNFKYKTSESKLDSCELCHQSEILNTKSCGYCHTAKSISEKGKKLNPYGNDLKKNLNLTLNESFKKIEKLDSNKDGVTNIKKIRDKSFPGENKSKNKNNDNKKIIDLLKWIGLQ